MIDVYPRLAKGTIEHVIVEVKDVLENLATLVGTSPVFSTRLEYESTYIEQDIAASVIGLKAFCLIDTTQVGYVVGVYNLFLQFNNLPEVPRLGPMNFEVV
jgi:hypothetical protein